MSRRSVACQAAKDEVVPPVGVPQVNKINRLPACETLVTLIEFQGIPILSVPPQPMIVPGLLRGEMSAFGGKTGMTPTRCHFCL